MPFTPNTSIFSLKSIVKCSSKSHTHTYCRRNSYRLFSTCRELEQWARKPNLSSSEWSCRQKNKIRKISFASSLVARHVEPYSMNIFLLIQFTLYLQQSRYLCWACVGDRNVLNRSQCVDEPIWVCRKSNKMPVRRYANVEHACIRFAWVVGVCVCRRLLTKWTEIIRPKERKKLNQSNRSDFIARSEKRRKE